jgi:ribonucleoside-diphosphate reductase alpha chain
MPFIKVADAGGGAIKSGGTTRRAAKMVVMNVDHPDIREFINCKVDSENMVGSMVTGSSIINECCQKIMDEVSRMQKQRRERRSSGKNVKLRC